MVSEKKVTGVAQFTPGSGHHAVLGALASDALRAPIAVEGVMPRSDIRAKNVPRVEYDHRARQARLALERLEHVFVAPPAAGPLRLALRGLVLVLRGWARHGEQPCRDADVGSGDYIWRTATSRGGAEVTGSCARHAGVAAKRGPAAGSDGAWIGWPAHPCDFVAMRGGGASSRSRRLPSTGSTRKPRHQRATKPPRAQGRGNNRDSVVDEAAEAGRRHGPVPYPTVGVEPPHHVGELPAEAFGRWRS